METRIGRMLEMLLRTRSMLERPEFASMASSSAIAALERTIGDLQAYESQQDLGARGSRGETARQRKLRAVLLDRMRTVSAAARLEMPKGPELVKLSTPRGGSSARRLLGAAAGMSAAAVEHKDVLLVGGLEPDFIDGLNGAAAAYQSSLTGRADHRGSRHQATTAMRDIATRVRQLVLVLTGPVKHLLAENPGMLAEWRQVTRLGKKLGGARGGDASSAAPLIPEVTAQPA